MMEVRWWCGMGRTGSPFHSNVVSGTFNINLILISYQTNTYVDQVEIAITIGEDHYDGIRRHRLPTSTIESFLT